MIDEVATKAKLELHTVFHKPIGDITVALSTIHFTVYVLERKAF